jgi:hypothetical protein
VLAPRWPPPPTTFDAWKRIARQVMSDSSLGPTPYPPINALLRQLLDGTRRILGEQLLGLYLSGSLALGDFDPTSSDIDFVAVLTRPPDAVTVAALTQLHATLRTGASGGVEGGSEGSPKTPRMEGFYVPHSTVRQPAPPSAEQDVCFAGWTSFGVRRLRWDWVIECYVVREHGVVLAGPPPAVLFAPISREELMASVRATLVDDWSQQVDSPEWMFPRYEQAFVILTMCRAWYVLTGGLYVSKPEAARWAQQHLPPEWTPLIERALNWRADATCDEDGLRETLRFVRFTLSHS